MAVAAKWSGRLEAALAVAGLLFLGAAFAATAARWSYQSSQQRAIRAVAAPALPARGDGAADPLVLGRIEIPRVGIGAIVREGTDEATLALAVGHVRGTARPGQNGNTVLAGHRDTFFRGLRNIRMNDRIRLVVPPHTFQYHVVSLEVVAPDELRVLDPTKDEMLTLVTCHPFRYIGHAPRRFIVRAARVD